MPELPPPRSDPTNNTTPHHLICIPPDPRPYHTNLSFIATDFLAWGHLVQTLPPSSPHLLHHLSLDRRALLRGRQRARPLLLWANEALRRSALRNVPSAHAEESPSGAADSISAIMADFLRGLVQNDSPKYKYSPPYFAPHTPTPYAIPPSTPPVLALYTSILAPILVTYDAPHPKLGFYFEEERLVSVRLAFAAHRNRNKELIRAAMRFAVERRDGRVGEVWKGGGVRCEADVVVRMWVRLEDGEDGGEEEELPAYEGCEGDAPPPAYDEVVVMEPE